MLTISKRIIVSIGIILLICLCFYSLPYKTQIKFAQIPLAVGGNIPDTFGDVIIIPGSGSNPGRGTEERLNLASALYQKKKRKVIVSEGTCLPHERSQFVLRMIKGSKIDSTDIIWDTLSLNTLENIKNVQSIAQKLGLKSVIVCTSPFHQLRCSILMKKIWKHDFKIAKIYA